MAESQAAREAAYWKRAYDELSASVNRLAAHRPTIGSEYPLDTLYSDGFGDGLFVQTLGPLAKGDIYIDGVKRYEVQWSQDRGLTYMHELMPLADSLPHEHDWTTDVQGAHCKLCGTSR